MRFIKQPFDEFLGLEYERVSATCVNIRLPLKPMHFNSVGVVHGGIISTLVDVAMSNLVEADDRGMQRAVTIDLHTTFLQGATGEELVAEASTVKHGRTLMYANCQVYNQTREVVARATGTFFIKEQTK